MKYICKLTLLSIFLVQFANAQDLRLKKGMITDIEIQKDSVSQMVSLYLPDSFELQGKWPLLIICDMDGKAKQSLSLFKQASENHGYLLAAPQGLSDTLSIGNNMALVQRTMIELNEILPLHKERTYTAGFNNGGRFANLIPVFINNISGVISIGSTLANTEVLTQNNPFHFIGIVGTSDFNYVRLLEEEQVLNKLKFQNNLLVYDGDSQLPKSTYLERAINLFDVSSMAKGVMAKNDSLIMQWYQNELAEINKYKASGNLMLADRSFRETITAFRPLFDVDSLRKEQRDLKRSKLYRSQKRTRTATLFNERLKRDEYDYYMEDDIITYNYKNLGWWKYQIAQLNNKIKGNDKAQQRMARRLKAYINALIDDNIILVKADEVVDEEALVLLHMMKTITQPENAANYLNVISIASKNLDYGTALFYTEELLKTGYKDKGSLYDIEHTNLFKITPEFNGLIEKYLGDPRYKVPEVIEE